MIEPRFDPRLSWTTAGAGDEDRTRMSRLEIWGSTIELHPQKYTDIDVAKQG